MKRGVAALALALAACSGGGDPANTEAPDLETVAIERGVVRDPGDGSITGLYQRGGDRLCLVPAGETLRIGAFVLNGGRLGCSASGTARQSGDHLRIDFGNACELDARIEGTRIIFPANLPPQCAQRCTARATFSGLRVEQMSDVLSEAAALRDPRGRAVCGG
ncbi:hypothetical protein LK533_03590 [Sphingomonas sp. PL-96]|uniref:hypothetical protein n=1 Tax=Sphingomonas sp. PL-96 TaxID=2887201 RepID=UPI001E36887C|nr:hypothetical protein [Sphingomonas sp. PL-96]MCC2975758.1 hypothetical protein [Sphingomonas sp. PL-96]